jgi:hypothetical protein
MSIAPPIPQAGQARVTSSTVRTGRSTPGMPMRRSTLFLAERKTAECFVGTGIYPDCLAEGPICDE